MAETIDDDILAAAQSELDPAAEAPTTSQSDDGTAEGAHDAGAAEDGQTSDDRETGEVSASPLESDAGESETKTEAPETVPLAKYLELRNENKQLGQRMDRVMSALEKDAAAREAAAQSTKESDKPDPRFVNEVNKDEDYMGWMEREMQIKDARIQDLADRQAKSDERTAASSEDAEFMADVAATEAAFEAEHGDYRQAVDYLRDIESKKIMAHLNRMIRIGRTPELTDAQKNAAVQQQIRRNEMAFARGCRDAGDNPIEAFYDMALASGYSPPQAGEGGEAGNGKAELTPAEKKLLEKEAQAKESTSLDSGSAAMRDAIERGTGDEFEAALRARGLS